VVITILSGHILALTFSYSATFLFRSVVSLLSGNLVALLFRFILGHLPVFSVAFLSVFSVAFLLRYLLAVLLGNLVTLLPGNLVADLSGLVETFLLGDNRSNSLLDILTLTDRNGSTHRLVDIGAFFILNILGVRDRFGVAVLFAWEPAHTSP